MWICLNNGFLSCVVDPSDPSRLTVRVRRKADLLRVFGPGIEILETPQDDYRWRAFITRDKFKQVVNNVIDGINYSNFTNSVSDHDLRRMYERFWVEHFEYGEAIPKNFNVGLAYGSDGRIRRSVKNKKT